MPAVSAVRHFGVWGAPQEPSRAFQNLGRPPSIASWACLYRHLRLPSRTHALWSLQFHDQNAARRMGDDVAGHAAHQELVETGAAMRADDHQVRSPAPGCLHQRRTGITVNAVSEGGSREGRASALWSEGHNQRRHRVTARNAIRGQEEDRGCSGAQRATRRRTDHSGCAGWKSDPARHCTLTCGEVSGRMGRLVSAGRDGSAERNSSRIATHWRNSCRLFRTHRKP